MPTHTPIWQGVTLAALLSLTAVQAVAEGAAPVIKAPAAEVAEPAASEDRKSVV